MPVIREGNLTRPIEHQFPPSVVARLRAVSDGFSALRVDKRASSYFASELTRAIEAGLLLAALSLGSTLLEIWLRDILAHTRASQLCPRTKAEWRYHLTRIDREIEGTSKRGLLFNDILKELERSGVIFESEKGDLASLYSSLRNPLAHGLTGKLTDPHFKAKSLLASAASPEDMFLAGILGGSPIGRSDALEDYLERHAIKHLEALLHAIERHPIAPESRV